MRNRLREERQKKGLTQKQVAEIVNLTERGYKFIEYGQRMGTIEVWDKLEDLFNVHQRLLRQNDPKDSQ